MTRKNVVRASAAALALAGLLMGGCGKEAAPAASTVKLDWVTNLPKGLEKAKAEKKAVFLDFTGVDWCPPCILLEKKVLKTKAFKDYADANLVLVLVDVPEFKSPSDEMLALLKKYEVEHYPTIFLLDGDGKQLGKIDNGYDGKQTPAEFIADVEKARKKARKKG